MSGIVKEDRTPSFEEVQAICKSLDSEEYAEKVFNALTKQGFKDGEGKSIVDLKAYVDATIDKMICNERKKKEKEKNKAENQKYKNKYKNRVPDVENKYKKKPQPEEERLDLDKVIEETTRQYEEKMKRTNQEQPNPAIPPYEEDIPDLRDSFEKMFE